jgi:hypothetical protein
VFPAGKPRKNRKKTKAPTTVLKRTAYSVAGDCSLAKTVAMEESALSLSSLVPPSDIKTHAELV